jgi:hypothetical protein
MHPHLQIVSQQQHLADLARTARKRHLRVR